VRCSVLQCVAQDSITKMYCTVASPLITANSTVVLEEPVAVCGSVLLKLQCVAVAVCCVFNVFDSDIDTHTYMQIYT